MNVVYHREAEAELIVAAQYYESKVPDLGAGFLDEIDAAVQATMSVGVRGEKDLVNIE